MSANWVKQPLLFILLILLQIGLFNRIHLFGYAMPLLYIYFIIKLPIDMNRNLVLLLSFLMGTFVDMGSYTLGLNMTACTLTGFSRHYALKLFTPRDLFESVSPSFSSFGVSLFVRYAAFLTMIHVIIVFLIESLTLFDPVQLGLRIAGSFLITIILVLAFETLSLGLKKK